MLFRRSSTRELFESEAMPHLDSLVRVAARMVGDHVAAEDLVQETYLQAWKSFDRYTAGTNCRAWLYSILFHKIQHHRRSLATRKVIPIAGGEEHLIDDLAAEPAVPEEIRDEEILQALESLSDDYRAVVLLADVQELPYKEVAEILSVPIGTVMSRLSRGRRLLRIALAECARDYGIRNPKEKKEE